MQALYDWILVATDPKAGYYKYLVGVDVISVLRHLVGRDDKMVPHVRSENAAIRCHRVACTNYILPKVFPLQVTTQAAMTTVTQ